MSFFTFDIEDAITNGEWQTAEIDSKTALQRRIELKPMQMGMFSLLDVTKFIDGTIWLDFHSSKYAPNKQLMDFMAYCASVWGTDSLGRGVPSNADMDPLRNGTFGRTWQNVKIVQIKRPGEMALSVTLRIIIDNQDMSNFAKNLAKGFIRSAVNQVGRDGGRVISNSLYDSKNYVPFANVTQQNIEGESQPLLNTSGTPENYAVEEKPLSGNKIFCLIILAVLLYPLGTLGVFFYGLGKLFDKTMVISWTESKPVYGSDNRYKSNLRFEGFSTPRHTKKVYATPEVIAMHKQLGIVSMSIGAVFGIIITIAIIAI